MGVQGRSFTLFLPILWDRARDVKAGVALSQSHIPHSDANGAPQDTVGRDPEEVDA